MLLNCIKNNFSCLIFEIKTYHSIFPFFMFRLGETKQYTKGIDNQTTFDEPVPKNIPRKRYFYNCEMLFWFFFLFELS